MTFDSFKINKGSFLKKTLRGLANDLSINISYLASYSAKASMSFV